MRQPEAVLDPVNEERVGNLSVEFPSFLICWATVSWLTGSIKEEKRND